MNTSVNDYTKEMLASTSVTSIREGLGSGAEDLEPLIAAIADLRRLNVIRVLIHVITWL